MTYRTRLQLILGGIGFVVWIAGVKVDNSRLRWVGIVFLAAATLLRFMKRLDRQEPHEPPADS